MIAYALRSLVRTPAFTAAATLTLALGIGAATAVYSVVHAIVLRPLPFARPERLVYVSENQRPNNLPRMSFAELAEWRSRTTTLSGMTTLTFDPQMTVVTPVGVTRLTGGLVATNYFELLGLQAYIGRTITSADDSDPSVVSPQLRRGGSTSIATPTSSVERREPPPGNATTTLTVIVFFLRLGGSWRRRWKSTRRSSTRPAVPARWEQSSDASVMVSRLPRPPRKPTRSAMRCVRLVPPTLHR